MTKTKWHLLFAAAALACGLATRATALPLYYEISGGSVAANTSDPGLVIGTSISPGLSGTHFTLDDGISSGWFDFFTIWTPERTVNCDDTVARLITATLYFADPLANATVKGHTFGGKILWGVFQWGQVEWDGPSTVVLGDRTFSIKLSDQIFNPGIFGLGHYPPAVQKKTEGGTGGTIKAEITQISSSKPTPGGDHVPVPEAADTLLLLSIGLFAALVLRVKSLPASKTTG